MAASYWASTQHKHWEKTKTALQDIRVSLDEGQKILIQQFPLPERRLINIYFQQQIAKLGRRLSIRQHVLATAHIFICRYYTKVEIRRTNPYLVMATAFYLACKIEECPQHIRVVVTEARNMWPELLQPETSKLGECEFSLISELNAQLMVHHPYRFLGEYQNVLALSQDELALAWSIVNDHYVTDLPLIWPPQVVAAMAITLAVAIRPSQTTFQIQTMSRPSATGAVAAATTASVVNQAINTQISRTMSLGGGSQNNKAQRLMTWLASIEMNIEAVVDATQEMISLYQLWDAYSEKTCKEQLSRFIKARGLDK